MRADYFGESLMIPPPLKVAEMILRHQQSSSYVYSTSRLECLKIPTSFWSSLDSLFSIGDLDLAPSLLSTGRYCATCDMAWEGWLRLLHSRPTQSKDPAFTSKSDGIYVGGSAFLAPRRLQ